MDHRCPAGFILIRLIEITPGWSGFGDLTAEGFEGDVWFGAAAPPGVQGVAGGELGVGQVGTPAHIGFHR
jgi:hypothetical protein